MRRETRWGAQVQAYYSNTTPFLIDSFFFIFTLLFLICKLIFLYSIISYSNNIFVFGDLADKYFIVPNFNFINEPDLMRIFQSEIFVNTDGQLQAAHIILGYKAISTSFQAPKYVIKAKDPRLYQINIAVLGFLTGPPPEGTHLIELPSQCSAKEEATSSHLVFEEATKVVEVSDSEEDFEIFDQPQSLEPSGATFSHLTPAQVSSVLETFDIPNTMVLQRKPKTSLLKLFESHAGRLVPEVAVQTRPPTPLPTHTSQLEPTNKKRKWD